MKVVQLLEVLNVALKRREDKKIKAFVELDKVLVVHTTLLVRKILKVDDQEKFQCRMS